MTGCPAPADIPFGRPKCRADSCFCLYRFYPAAITAIIMSPHNPELDDDFVLGIALSIIWKAPRLRSRNMNQASFPNMQKLAKLNNSTTYFLAGIATRAARVNELNQTPALLMAGDTSPETIARCRLWLWMCFVDAHGCMQNGRAASIDLTDRCVIPSLPDASFDCTAR